MYSVCFRGDDPGRHANRGAVVRDVFDYDRIGPDLCAVPDPDVADDLGAGTDVDIVTDDGFARAQRDAVADANVVADDGVLVQHDAELVPEIRVISNAGAVRNMRAVHDAYQQHEESWQDWNMAAVKPMGEIIQTGHGWNQVGLMEVSG